jgi:predicted HNH restriction endonuclease
MEEDTLPAVPDAARYADALTRLFSQLSDLHRAMLIAHYRAPGHIASARELAEAVGAAGWQVVNSQYGQLGAMLRDTLDFRTEGQQSYVIASFIPPGGRGNDEWAWVMHPELAAALESLGWVADAEKAVISVFHGDDAETHRKFQAWRKAHIDGFHMTEGDAGQFTIHYTQDKRENLAGRGCVHQGGSDNDYLGDKDGCYTTARKVCSDSLAKLIAWAAENGFTTKNCKHCDTTRFPFPAGAPRPARLAEEVTRAGLVEGEVCQVVINAYERNPIARSRCIAHYGPSCVVCGFNFGAVYGPLAEGFIHVHHVKPMSEIGAAYEVDPVADLRPVCPNCHAVIHLGGECRSIEAVRQLLQLGTGPSNA